MTKEFKSKVFSLGNRLSSQMEAVERRR